MSDEEKVIVPFTYNLTEMVGRRSNSDRTMIVASFEVRRDHFIIAAAAAVPAILVGLVAGVVVGVYGVLATVAVIAAAFWLFGSSTTEGLRVKQWEALNDRRIAGTGRVFLCQREVDPLAIDVFSVKAGAVPVPQTQRTNPTTQTGGPNPARM